MIEVDKIERVKLEPGELLAVTVADWRITPEQALTMRQQLAEALDLEPERVLLLVGEVKLHALQLEEKQQP